MVRVKFWGGYRLMGRAEFLIGNDREAPVFTACYPIAFIDDL